MATTKQKLELTWIGKGKDPVLEPRILIEDPEKSYGDPDSENILIHGDNLLALKALEQDYTNKIKCIYIDPPYNTGSAFTHYDDNLQHSTWLNLMKPRLEILKKLLKNDGSMWVSIDADESHYLKVLCDEVFGRNNFVDEVIWQRAYSPINLKKTLSRSHDTILVYAKNKSETFSLNKLPRSDEANNRYSNPDNDTRGVWKSSDCSVGPRVENNVYEIKTPSGRKVLPPNGRSWLYSKERFQEMLKDNRVWFGPNGSATPSVKKFLSEVRDGVVAMTLWTYQEVGHNQDAKKEIKLLFNEDVFTTPKPEKLLERIITLGSNVGDFVLDSFLGTGTTSAVAHKMGRNWIGIEIGEHATTHCLPRLKKVVDGNDGLPLSKSIDWKGGGGFKFYELASSLLNKDDHGNWVISEEYDANRLAAAMAKHNNFKYQPDQTFYWKQGQSTEKDFIFTTTNFITVEFLDKIHEEMQPGESLLICCKSYQEACESRHSNISIKKIPQMILGKCEFGREDYSLNIINVPTVEDEMNTDIQSDEDSDDIVQQKSEVNQLNLIN